MQLACCVINQRTLNRAQNRLLVNCSLKPLSGFSSFSDLSFFKSFSDLAICHFSSFKDLSMSTSCRLQILNRQKFGGTICLLLRLN